MQQTGRRYLIGTAKSELRKWARAIADAHDWQSVREGVEAKLCAGPDGLVNTADDIPCPASGPCAAGPECVVLPGPDGILGTPDDTAMSLANFTRQIQIFPVAGYTTLSQIIVTVTYTQGTSTHTYVVTSLISAFR